MTVLSERLRELRVAEGWTRNQAADQVGVPRSTWGDWERGIRPHPAKLRRIAEVFPISHDELGRLYLLSSEAPQKPKRPSMPGRVARLEAEVAELRQSAKMAVALLEELRRNGSGGDWTGAH